MPPWVQGLNSNPNFNPNFNPPSPASNSSDRFYDAAEGFSASPKHDASKLNFQNSPSSSSSNVADDATSPFSKKYSPIETPLTSRDEDEDEDEDEGLDDFTGNDVESQRKLVDEGIDEVTDLSARKQSEQPLKSVLVSDFIYPKSRYIGYKAPLPPSKEHLAVQDLLKEVERRKAEVIELERKGTQEPSDDFVEIELSNFSVYLPEGVHNYSFELRPLQHLWAKKGVSSFLFDGILSVGKVRHYVQGVPFALVSIGNYGEEIHTVGGDIWIQSCHNSKSNIYYKLTNPASEYHRFYQGFLWLADFAKHFVDYSQACGRSAVSVFNFRSDFSRWVKRHHGKSDVFHTWYGQYGKDDFRQVVAVHIFFLFKESVGVDEGLRVQPIWNELLDMDAIPRQSIKEQKTIVTPFVYECFKDMNFGAYLKPIKPKAKASPRNATTKDSVSESSTPARKIVIEVPAKRTVVRVGDVIAVTTDGESSEWKDEISKYKEADNCWYLYVQAIHEPRREGEERSFDALWLYKPSDTSCAKMRYPFPTELFLSDNCTCSRGRILQSEVLEVVTVLWNCDPSKANNRLFVRQTWLENERFVTVQEGHKWCSHIRATSASSFDVHFPAGQTVLCRPPRGNKRTLEAYEVVRHLVEDDRNYTLLRRLLRRHLIDGRGRPNELTYTNQVDKIPSNRIDRKCLVRFYSEADVVANAIPVPYCRDGVGSCFYITTRLVKSEIGEELIPIDTNLPRKLIQGFDPLEAPSREPLRGLDLYCGGGNFGRGIEEGGAVHNEWAADLYDAAIHTYNANLKTPGSTKLFYGSVNDLLLQAMEGNPKNSKLIPTPGEVEFISAGSPCQGFSQLNPHKDNEKGLRNQSLVASVAAYIDFYRPKYGILENVITMAQKGLRRDQDPLSQLICAIVGMGYQLEIFVLDAWSHGSPQSRSRLFVCFTAPGLTPLNEPDLTHSHPANVGDRGLGRLANGQNFGQRRDGPTPFKYITAGEATHDLPVIGDAHTYQCTSFPYHVPLANMSKLLKVQIEAIPTHPRGMNFAKSWNEGHGVMTLEERSLFPHLTKGGKIKQAVAKNARSWGRVNPLGLFPTIVVHITAFDARMGTCLHWDQHRYLTVAEAQRAQSYPDGEVLVGLVADQWKILGNSVARTVSMALGLKLREAWLANPTETDTTQNSVVNEAQPKVPRKPKEEIGNSVSTTNRTVIVISDSDDDEEDLLATNSSKYQVNRRQTFMVSKPANRPPRASEVLNQALHISKTKNVQSAPPGLERVITQPGSLKRSYDLFEPGRGLVARPLPASGALQVAHLNGESSPSIKTSIEVGNDSHERTQFCRRPGISKAFDSLGSTAPIQGQTIFVDGGVDLDADDDSEDSGFEFAPGSDSDNEDLEEVLGPGLSNNTPGNSSARHNVRSESESSDELARPSAVSQPLGQERRFINRTTRTPDIVRMEAALGSSRKPKTNLQVFINLVSDDEGERDMSTSSQTLATTTPKQKYVPVDNTQFGAYAQTYHSMNNTSSSKRRKL